MTGILERTGTPLDRSVLVSLAGIEAIHVDWQSGRPPVRVRRALRGGSGPRYLEPSRITVFLVGLKSRVATFRLQRAINDPQETLTAILPGVALSRLWSVIGTVERVLLAISACVVLAGLIGMVTTLLNSLSERRREMAILRAVGARPWHIFALFMFEATAIGVAAATLGAALVFGGFWLGAGPIEQATGLHLRIVAPGVSEAVIVGLVIAASALAGAIPAWRAYRTSLADGLSIRL